MPSLLRLTDFESQAAEQRDRLFFGQGAPKFLVLPNELPRPKGRGFSQNNLSCS